MQRASRALWLLCPHVLLPLPPPEPFWPVPSRSSQHLTLAAATDNDEARIRELFPELEPDDLSGSQPGVTDAPQCNSQPTDVAAVSQQPCTSSTMGDMQPVGRAGGSYMHGWLPAPSAAEVSNASSQHDVVAAPEPFHDQGKSLMVRMLVS